MSFYNEIKKYDVDKLLDLIQSKKDEDVINALEKKHLTLDDFMALLSPAGEKYLEIMAQKSRELKIMHFGYGIELFTPMYLANYCENLCVYCGFRHTNKITRSKLNLAEIKKEAQLIKETGLCNVLILTGESYEYSDIDYIIDSIKILKDIFPEVGMEIYALSEENYKQTYATGVDSMTLFQEVYNEKIYEKYHLKGPKKDYLYRLDAPERACRSNFRNVNIGALLGLDNFYTESFFTGLHGYYLQNKYRNTQIAISVPRIRPSIGGFIPKFNITDKNIVQMICALRIFMPTIGITISSRESKIMRDNLVNIGITKMSAGVSVSVCGHSKGEESQQFLLSDDRNVDDIAQMLYSSGNYPIYQNWL